MKYLYPLFAALSLAFFSWAQYNAYGLFDNVADERLSGRSTSQSIYHK